MLQVHKKKEKKFRQSSDNRVEYEINDNMYEIKKDAVVKNKTVTFMDERNATFGAGNESVNRKRKLKNSLITYGAINSKNETTETNKEEDGIVKRRRKKKKKFGAESSNLEIDGSNEEKINETIVDDGTVEHNQELNKNLANKYETVDGKDEVSKGSTDEYGTEKCKRKKKKNVKGKSSDWEIDESAEERINKDVDKTYKIVEDTQELNANSENKYGKFKHKHKKTNNYEDESSDHEIRESNEEKINEAGVNDRTVEHKQEFNTNGPNAYEAIDSTHDININKEDEYGTAKRKHKHKKNTKAESSYYEIEESNEGKINEAVIDDITVEDKQELNINSPNKCEKINGKHEINEDSQNEYEVGKKKHKRKKKNSEAESLDFGIEKNNEEIINEPVVDDRTVEDKQKLCKNSPNKCESISSKYEVDQNSQDKFETVKHKHKKKKDSKAEAPDCGIEESNKEKINEAIVDDRTVKDKHKLSKNSPNKCETINSKHEIDQSSQHEYEIMKHKHKKKNSKAESFDCGIEDNIEEILIKAVDGDGIVGQKQELNKSNPNKDETIKSKDKMNKTSTNKHGIIYDKCKVNEDTEDVFSNYEIEDSEDDTINKAITVNNEPHKCKRKLKKKRPIKYKTIGREFNIQSKDIYRLVNSMCKSNKNSEAESSNYEIEEISDEDDINTPIQVDNKSIDLKQEVKENSLLLKNQKFDRVQEINEESKDEHKIVDQQRKIIEDTESESSDYESKDRNMNKINKDVEVNRRIVDDEPPDKEAKPKKNSITHDKIKSHHLLKEHELSKKKRERKKYPVTGSSDCGEKDNELDEITTLMEQKKAKEQLPTKIPPHKKKKSSVKHDTINDKHLLKKDIGCKYGLFKKKRETEKCRATESSDGGVEDSDVDEITILLEKKKAQEQLPIEKRKVHTNFF